MKIASFKSTRVTQKTYCHSVKDRAKKEKMVQKTQINGRAPHIKA